MKPCERGTGTAAILVTGTPGVHEFMTAAPSKLFSRSRLMVSSR